MCGFSFTVFVSAFQLLPTAPFHIIALGGSEFAAGLFLGLLTYASAVSAPITGALADRFGRRRLLVVCSLCLCGFSIAYSVGTNYRVLLGLVVVHGIFWSGLLTASSAYALGLIPESRRAEGIGYWGLSSIAAVAVAPSIGLLLYGRGWEWVCGSSAVLNLAMTAIAWRLPADEPGDAPLTTRLFHAGMVEWRVLVLSFTLFLAAFGYGGLTSFVALYAVAFGITPASGYFTLFALSILFTRPFSGRLTDRIGSRKVLYPCLVLVVVGLALLSVAPTRNGFIVSALVFGLGFGSIYPAFTTFVIGHVPPARRGAAFGGILAAFDTGIGTGSIVMGAIIGRYGFPRAFGVAACVAALALPYFAVVEGRVLGSRESGSGG